MLLKKVNFSKSKNHEWHIADLESAHYKLSIGGFFVQNGQKLPHLSINGQADPPIPRPQKPTLQDLTRTPIYVPFIESTWQLCQRIYSLSIVSGAKGVKRQSRGDVHGSCRRNYGRREYTIPRVMIIGRRVTLGMVETLGLRSRAHNNEVNFILTHGG